MDQENKQDVRSKMSEEPRGDFGSDHGSIGEEKHGQCNEQEVRSWKIRTALAIEVCDYQREEAFIITH